MTDIDTNQFPLLSLPPHKDLMTTGRKLFPPAVFHEFPLEPILSDLIVESYDGERDDDLR